jgi:hypothetical protein
MALSRLDQHINDLTPADSTFGGMQMGDPNAFKTLWNESKGNYAAGMRGENVEDRINNAKVNTDAANSGMNLGNNLRAQFKPMLKDTDLMRGMDPVERAAVKNLVKGNFATNAMRYGSNVLGGGGGIGSLAIPLIAGGAIGGGLGSPSEGNASAAGLALMGHLLRRGANASTLRQANYLSALVRSRAPMSPGMVMPQSLLAKRLLNAASASQQQ